MSQEIDNSIAPARAQIRRVLTLFRVRVSTPLSLSVVLPGVPIFIDADRVRLVQVLANLLDNAAKYTPDGGQIRLSVQASVGQVEIRVRDTGVGIPSEKLPVVFDLFAQLDGSSERSCGGFGIGLTVVRLLAEQHGGTVEASSDGLGKGSQFTVRLPRVSKACGRESPQHLQRASDDGRSPRTDETIARAEVVFKTLVLGGRR